MPSSRLPMPPRGVPGHAGDDRGAARIDAPALARLRLCAPRVGGVAVALAARAGAAHGQHVVPPRPLGSVLGDVEHGATPAVAAAFARRERHVRRRARQHVDVEQASPASAAKSPSVGESSGRAAPARGQPDLEALVPRSSGGGVLGGVAAEPVAAFAGTRRLQRAPARLASRAPVGSQLDRRADGSPGVAAEVPDADAPAQTRPRSGKQRPRELQRVEVDADQMHATRCGSGGRQRHAYVP